MSKQPAVVVFAAIVLLAALVPAAARADGGFFSRWTRTLYEYEQLAFLDWDEAALTETLVIMPGFRGDARDFAWVVPVPAVPAVAQSYRALFEDLDEISAPQYRRRDSAWNCDDEMAYDAGNAAIDSGVDVLSHEVIGVYDVMVVEAEDGAALTDSLTAWGFLHGGNRPAAAPILADYVARGWVFVTMTVDSAAFAAAYPDPYADYYYGGLQPIQLTFAAEAPVYPMRLSAISADWNTRVAVFAAAGHRLELPGGTAEYANRFTDAEFEALARTHPTAAAYVRPGRFLTRLERVMGPLQMTTDLVLTPAGDDREFRRLEYGELPFFGLFCGGSAAAWAAWKIRRRLAMDRGRGTVRS